MIPAGAETPPPEIVIHYIFGKHIRADKTIRRQAFMPPRNLKYSVTKKRNLSEDQIWAFGHGARGDRVDSLKGRADVPAHIFIQNGLAIEDAPTVSNDHHADVVGWPGDDQSQRNLADVLADQAGPCGVFLPERADAEM